MSKFTDWTSSKLEDHFGLQRQRNLTTLTNWLNAPAELSDFERQSLTVLRSWLSDNVDNWNEQELSLHFIGPVFTLVQFGEYGKFNLFAARPMSAIIGDDELSGIPDGLIAKGWNEPKVPYFCLHEYKKEVDPSGDPLSQCLAAMLVARQLNPAPRPIYGCVVIGRNWRFLVMEGAHYAVSDVFVSTQEDIFDILRILKVLKAYIIAAL